MIFNLQVPTILISLILTSDSTAEFASCVAGSSPKARAASSLSSRAPAQLFSSRVHADAICEDFSRLVSASVVCQFATVAGVVFLVLLLVLAPEPCARPKHACVSVCDHRCLVIVRILCVS